MSQHPLERSSPGPLAAQTPHAQHVEQSCQPSGFGPSSQHSAVAPTLSSVPDGRRLGGARMLAVVSLRPGEQGRKYRLPADSDYAAVQVAARRVTAMLDEWDMGGQKDLLPSAE